MAIQPEDIVVIEANDPHDLETKIELGLNTLISRAHEFGDRGILLTRRSPNDYLIELDPSVQFGVILERCEWTS